MQQAIPTSQTSLPPPLCKLRVQIVSARGLAAKDRNGKSDPFVVVSLPGAATNVHDDGKSYRKQTPVKFKTLDPVWKESESTFDFNVIPEWFGNSNSTLDHLELVPHHGHGHGQGGVGGGGGGDEDDDAAAATATATATTTESSPPMSTNPSSIKGFARTKMRLPVNSTRKLSGAASKLLVTPVKLGAAGAKAVGRGMPRPMLLRKKVGFFGSFRESASRPTSSTDVDPNLHIKLPRGSIHLDDSNGIVNALEFVIWDKDKFSANDYLGESCLAVSEWCRHGQVDWDKAQPVWLPIVSSKPDVKISGELQVKVGFVSSRPTSFDSKSNLPDAYHWSFEQVYQRLILLNLGNQGAAVRAIPATQSVGTAGPADAFVDDGLSSGSELDHDDDASSDQDSDSDVSEEVDALDGSDSEAEGIYDEHYNSIAVVPDPDPDLDPSASHPSPLPNVTYTKVTPQPISQVNVAPTNQPGGRYRRIFSRSKSGNDKSGTSTPLSSDPASADTMKRRRIRVKRKTNLTQHGSAAQPTKTTKPRTSRHRQEFAFKAEMGMDIIGIVMMEVKAAKDLPRWKNMTHTSFDMDPFTIVSFGQKIFRTRVVRHTLNPSWNEKLLFHVRRHEANFQAKFMIYDWDKISFNDYVGGASIEISQLIDTAPKPDSLTGLYDFDGDDGVQKMKEFVLPLSRLEKDEDVKFKGNKQAPTLTIEAKFTPYNALRQRFWRQLALQYDSDRSGTLSQLELATMLDSLGSTLSTKTINSFFQQCGKNPETDELTFDQVIRALEDEIKKPWAQKGMASSGFDSGAQTPLLPSEPPSHDADMGGGRADIGGSGVDAPMSDPSSLDSAYFDKLVPPPSGSHSDNEPMQKRLETDLLLISDVRLRRQQVERCFSGMSLSSSSSSFSESGAAPLTKATQGDAHYRNISNPSSGFLSTSPSPPLVTVEAESVATEDVQAVERVIRLKSCPLCHMPRLSKKAEVDIVTHLAVCASQDWRRVDSLAVRNFVTASQAQRKWYVRVVNKLSQGNYSLGANSANIIVQDRISGELMEEKMQVYVRLGIRLLYKGAKSRMESARIKRMLKNMSINQGAKFDSVSSAKEIAPFIAFHNLDTGEILDALDSFKTFNQFFYRKLKPGARPVAEPLDACRLVSGADCRMMAFDSVQEATKVWIKGRDFTIARLLGEAATKGLGSTMDGYQNGGSLAIFRLAPQDYHRFHCPADAVVGKFSWIEGQYYTVNPMAVRSTIDVYGENVRVVVPFHSKQFGTFFAVCIGAMMVGSTVLTVKEGDHVERGQEFGYFKFGGSTIVLVFEKEKMVFDQDLLDNSRAAIETLVRVGMAIGRASVE